jgi:SnoaL-like domain
MRLGVGVERAGWPAWTKRGSLRDTGRAMFEERTAPQLNELFRSLIEAYNRADLDAIGGLFAPGAVLDLSDRGVGVFEGRDAVCGFLADYFGSFDDLTYGPEEFIDLGRGITFAVVRQDARPAGVSGWVTTREGWVGEWAGGMVMRGSTHADVDGSRSAAERLALQRR